MEDQQIRIFNAIASFVKDLDGGFGKKYKPVALYNRLASKTTIHDISAIERHIQAFDSFFSANPGYIKDSTMTRGTRISYSERVYLDIDNILAKTTQEEHKLINKHLVTIYSLMKLGTPEGKEALETLKTTDEALDLNLPDTTEGNFIKETLNEMTEQFDNMGDNANPMMMMSSMMQSGFFTKFMGDLQSKFTSGDMDLRSLMGTVTSVISEATPEGSEEAEQIRNFVSQSMGQLSSLTGGENLPDDVQEQMNDMLHAMTGPKNDD